MTQVSELPNITRLLEIMARLRDPESGCPWDQKQTFKTIVPHTIEEAYEVADAIEYGTPSDVKDELGDLLFQVVFYAQLGQEQNLFDLEDIAEQISDKLIRRHPHVFDQAASPTDEQLHQQWEDIKRREREAKGDIDDSVLATIPTGMAPLNKATKIQKLCAKVGFDWSAPAPVIEKIKEEIDEVVAELDKDTINQQAVEEEIGDLLFAVVNLSRHLQVNPDIALRKANHKFTTRFRALETMMKSDNKSPEQASLEEMESYWLRVKAKE
ncbi:nucleoside triphosphate pyrophosphohydrolase [Aestuariibacter sp. AA17]|uniref:Nucleoside triphosphate pyrophosphohydrolase n=1 Tax=Fluctibacter corallii TaxID=2984329 RepID=A0ABT3A4H7_9ALTE|nr:nucleoside triphosphate pyrophosphohydrolase [Aestuariibacter sp. AA17]MCV2883549.1 nucleoside triphosphate pyrophosphohydrolase [Aestuariibacter sp. AA17]